MLPLPAIPPIIDDPSPPKLPRCNLPLGANCEDRFGGANGIAVGCWPPIIEIGMDGDWPSNEEWREPGPPAGPPGADEATDDDEFDEEFECRAVPPISPPIAGIDGMSCCEEKPGGAGEDSALDELAFEVPSPVGPSTGDSPRPPGALNNAMVFAFQSKSKKKLNSPAISKQEKKCTRTRHTRATGQEKNPLSLAFCSVREDRRVC
jgi:hypothetical protein